jgi:hypothetical protein
MSTIAHTVDTRPGTAQPSALEWLAAAILHALRQAPRCSGEEHGAGRSGHDGGPAVYRVTVGCPSCVPEGKQRLVCAGRVARVLDREAAGLPLRCYECGLSGPVSTFWHRIERIGQTA